jgi:hypothetical protein
VDDLVRSIFLGSLVDFFFVSGRTFPIALREDGVKARFVKDSFLVYESSKAVRLIGKRFANINIEEVRTDLKERVMSFSIVLCTAMRFFVTYFFRVDWHQTETP